MPVRHLLVLSVACLTIGHTTAGWLAAEDSIRVDENAVKRGKLAAQNVASPLTVSTRAFDDLWKEWGLAERPENFLERVSQRYGLLESKSDYPLGLHEFAGPFGKGVAQNCLLCHVGRIGGKTIAGLGNASIDLQSLVEDLTARDILRLELPLDVGHGRGITEASNGVAYLLSLRDKDFNLHAPPFKLRYKEPLCQDIPAWWLLHRKRTMFHTGSTDARALRSNLTFLLAPIYSGDFVRSQVPMSRDIKQYILSLKAPRYPFRVDDRLAERGKTLFLRKCSRCHGTYGPNGKYPNKIVPLEVIGTDATLARRFMESTEEEARYYSESWLMQEKGPNGEAYHDVNRGGYQAPPLDGVWATAPYFHNGSVPTVYHVLKSTARPTVFTRSFQTDEEDYDQGKLGWKVETLSGSPEADLPGHIKRRITDTTQPARGNDGHQFGDDLTDGDRLAVIEYLKTI